MKSLTKEERAAKFAAKKDNGPGLISRGNRAMSSAEQKEVFASLSKQAPSTRLLHLRSLREALLSNSTPKDAGFEAKVYFASVQECIDQNRMEAVPHMLAHMCTANKSRQWQNLYVISLSNTGQYQDAVQMSSEETDIRYITSLLTRDFPLWEKLVQEEVEPLACALMKQAQPIFKKYKQSIAAAYRRPGQKV